MAAGASDKKKPPRLGITISMPAAEPYSISPKGTYRDRQHNLAIGKSGFSIGAHAEPLRDLAGKDDVELLEEVGKGGAGVVYKARDRRNEGLLAVKVIRLEVDDTIRRRIVQELRTLHECSSPCIVDFAGAWFDAGAISIAMEFMDGGSMLDLVQRSGPMPEHVLAAVAWAVLSALDYLKTVHNIMHRDVKPANILVSRAGRLNVCDLGVSGTMQNSVAQSYVGTTSYMAPERIDSTAGDEDGGSRGYDITADVFSLGLSLVELGFGRYPYPIRPFGDPSPPVAMGYWALLEVLVYKPPPTMPPEHFTPDCCDFVASCLQKKPSERAMPATLLGHPFLAGCETDDCTRLAAWLAEVLSR